jgi:predicted acyl esterase
MLQWAGPQWAYEYLTVARKLPPIGAEPVQGANTGDDFGNDPQETGCGLPNSALVAGEDQFSGKYSDWHLARDWREGAKEADIPVFAVHGVNDNAARISALDWFLQRRDARDKLWLGQWDHGSGVGPTRRGLQFTAALHAWFDKQLAGRRVKTGPAVESFLADTSSFAEARAGARTEVLQQSRLPLNDTTLTLFPNADGGLTGAQPAEQQGSSFSGSPEGFSEFTAEDPSWTTGVSFSTEPQQSDVLLNGVPELQLTASVTAPRVHLIANLLDEDAEGKRRRISQFALNPELREGIAQRENVTPGEKYVMKPEGFVMAHHLRKGHRLVLQVTTSDPDKVPTFSTDPNVTVFTGGEDGTKVTLPIATKASLAADDVPFEAKQAVPDAPAQAPVEGSVTMKAPGLGTRVGGVTSEVFEFEVLPNRDNAKLEAIATPAQPADLDLYLERQAADGTWSAAGAGDNSGAMDGEKLSAGRLQPGKYRLDVHNWAGAPGNEVALKLTFFDSSGKAGS